MICGLLGEHLSHSYSPMIHSMIGYYDYRLFEVAPESLADFVKNGEYRAVNVTIPYKKAVIPYLDELSPRAAAIGSVNVIRRRDDGTLYGDNADYFGFHSLVKKSGIKIKNKKVLVLGSGGASATVCAVLHDMKAGEVVVISRGGENNYENIEINADADVIVNTTPVGMYPDNGKSPLDLRIFKNLSGVIDIIFNPAKTKLVLDAEDLGIRAVGGLHMLVYQAVASAEMFTDKKCSTLLADKIEKAVAGNTKNIVLIGMPGCGKTVIGRRLASVLQRPFIDLDAEIENKAGKSIPEIFEDDGEEAFRAVETECCAEAGRLSGYVISTGGGVVTRERNKQHLRQNATVIYLFRPLNKLATKNRPLSKTGNLEAMAKVRVPLYNEWSDIKMVNRGIGATTGDLIRILGLKRPKNNRKESNI